MNVFFMSLGCDKNLVDQKLCWGLLVKKVIDLLTGKRSRSNRDQYLLFYP